MKNILSIVIISLLVLLPNEDLQGQKIGRKVEWQIPAMTCIPTSKTIKENKYIAIGGVLRFKQGKTGQLVFTSPIAKPLPSGKYSIGGKVKITNTNESTNPQSVIISLRKKNMNTGVVETVLQTAPIQGSLLKNSGYQTIFSKTPRAIQFDFNNYTYWIELSFRRKNPSSIRVVSSIKLVRGVG